MTKRTEAYFSRLIQMAASKLGCRLMRNNRGMFLTIDGKRKTRAGLEAPGASDLIGWRTITVTEDMVGKRFAQFLAIEVKRPGGRIGPDQAKFLSIVNEAGGTGFVCDNHEDVPKLLKESEKWQ